MHNQYRAPTVTTRRTSRGGSPALQRGTGQQRAFTRRPRTSALLGIISIFCLIFAILCFGLSVTTAAHAFMNMNTTAMAGAGILAILSLLLPVAGTVVGIVGVSRRTSNKVVAAIGLTLNGLLVLLVLVGMVLGNNETQRRQTTSTPATQAP